MNESQRAVEINIRSPYYFIARTGGVCRNCEALIDLTSLVLPPGHQTLDLADDDDMEPVTDEWVIATHYALVFYIEFLSQSAAARVAALTQSFRVGHPYSGADPSWSNYCEACGYCFSDEESFCEPGGAFFPTNATEAARIKLLRIDESLEAAAGGYSLDPGFIHAMTPG